MAEFTKLKEEGGEEKVSEKKEGDEEELRTAEDRIKFLRDRGVLVELPEDRFADSNGSAKTVQVAIVKIPCNDSLPEEEIYLSCIEGKGGDAFLVALKPFFAASSTSSIKPESFDLLSTHGLTVSEDTLSSLAREGCVEAFPLSHPCEDNNYTRVNIYLDEVGE